VDLIIGNLRIEKVHSTRFLGVEIEDKLNWWNHTKFVERKVSSAIFVIRSLRYKINRTTALKLYDTLVLPYLLYCNIIWENTHKTYVLNICRLQKRALKLCHGRNLLAHENLFLVTNKLPFHNIHKLQTSLMVFQYFNNLPTLPNCIATLFTKTSEVHKFHTRSADGLCLHTHLAKTHSRKSSIKIYAPLLWNKLPIEIRRLSAQRLFKKTLKTFLQSELNITFD